MRHFLAFSSIAAGTVLLAGCGGGGSNATTDPGGSIPTGPTQNFGPIETRGQINGSPIVRDLNQISTVALAGILTDATYRPQGKEDNETAIVIGNGGSLDVRLESGELLDSWRPTTPEGNFFAFPQWNSDGSRLYFMTTTGIYYTTPSDPTTATQILGLSSGLQYFTLSPNGTKIAYTRTPPGETDYEVYVRDVAGGATKRLTTNDTNDFGGVWTDDEHVILSQKNGTADVDNVIHITDLSSAPFDTFTTGVVEGRNQGGTLFLAAPASANSNGLSLIQQYGNYYASKDYLPPEIGYIGPNGASPSPDGTRWAIQTSKFGVLTTEMYPDMLKKVAAASPVLAGLSWQPALGVTKFVGTAGKLGASAAGIVATRRTGASDRNGLASFLSWDATTRSTSTVSDDQTNVGAGTKTYTIEADKITSLKYGNRPFFLPQSIVSATGTQNGAIVSVDGSTGVITAVVVYTETRGAKPTVKRQGDGQVIEGAVQSVWNAKGQNIAPHGATRVELNAKGEPTVD